MPEKYSGSAALGRKIPGFLKTAAKK